LLPIFAASPSFFYCRHDFSLILFFHAAIIAAIAAVAAMPCCRCCFAIAAMCATADAAMMLMSRFAIRRTPLPLPLSPCLSDAFFFFRLPALACQRFSI